MWGSNFLWIKLALRGMSPALIVVARLALGAAVLIPIARGRGQRLPRGSRLWTHILVAAAIANVIPYLFFAIAEQHVDSSLAGMLNATTPLWAFTFALATRTETASSSRQVIGLMVGLAGVILVLSPWRSHASASTEGIVLCLLAAASYGLSYVYMAKFLANRDLPPLVLSASQLTAATVLAAMALPWARFGQFHVRTDALVSIVILGTVGTGLSYVLNYRLIADEGATTASLVTYLLPAVAILLGGAALNESIGPSQLFGIGLVLAGIALTHRSGAAYPPAPDRVTPNEP